MLTAKEHAQLLRRFEVDRLLKLVELTAKKLYDGHYTMLAFTTHVKVAFGTPDLQTPRGYAQVWSMPGYPTVKEALIAALVAEKDVYDYCEGDLDSWWDEEAGGRIDTATAHR